MAINGVVYSSHELQVGIAEESTFGTPVADSGAFMQLAEFDSVSVDYGLFQEIPLRNRNRRLVDLDDVYVSQTGGIRTITISGIPLRRGNLADLLYAVTQKVGESGTDPYQKMYQIDWADQPDFASSAGWFGTIALKKEINGYHEKFTSCIAKSLTIKYDGTSGDGRLKADVEFITGFAVSTTSTFSGTWTINTQTYFDGHAFNLKQLGGSDVVVYSWEMSINNNAARVGNDASGQCQTYSVGVGGNGMELTGSLKVKYDANVQGVLADYVAGTRKGITLATGTSGTAGYLDFSLDATILTGYTPEDVEQGKGITLPFTGVYQGGNEITITLADGVDKGW